MAKKDEVEEIEEIEETPPDDTKKIKEKVEKKIDKVEKRASANGRENIIGDITKPDLDDPDFDFKAWAKSMDEKLDKLLGGKEKPKEEPAEPPKKPKKDEATTKSQKAWYDEELF